MNKKIGNLGIDPATATIIVNLIVTGISYGLSAYQAAKQAKEQAAIQERLEDVTISAISQELATKTNIPFSQWYVVIKMTFSPDAGGGIPEPPELPKDSTAIYIAIGIMALMILRR